ncbi:hypothetical protein [Streptomyces sp. 5-10]|uniref:hypothetical protein n=1 Tax=Streptomyces sp. 5-10 TaxID=878925 RepID=UPI00168B59EF|nr:hypothetical protein [Streptomyces sp. 5-10]MBD3004671.1 hypothetical protein [Streptomyces sp. 5-10]
MNDPTTEKPDRSPAFEDALQNARHALLTADPVANLTKVITRFRDEYRAEIFREAADECDKAGGLYTGRALNDHAAGAFSLMETFRRKANEVEYLAAPCDPWVPCENGGEPCSTHERLMAHAEGDHELCGSSCTPPRPTHVGDQANAEDCPGCDAEKANLSYPFLCPAAPGAPARVL